ncbi:hypothetical protein DRO64_02130 [Candidatus Bathyarchaeota archaeon]|nr:MAG: hypothetical protein DRO64_02130 [Candidatus Bathyarchaeota archaeon]
MSLRRRGWRLLRDLKVRQRALGANAIVGLDLETSDLGLQAGVVVVSATGTAVIVEPE